MELRERLKDIILRLLRRGREPSGLQKQAREIILHQDAKFWVAFVKWREISGSCYIMCFRSMEENSMYLDYRHVNIYHRINKTGVI